MSLVMSLKPFKSMIGLAGVDPQERSKAIWWGHVFEWPMVFVAFWVLLEWYLDATGKLTVEYSQFTSLSVWLLFVLETAVLASLVENRARYLKANWMNLLIILVAIPFLLQTQQSYPLAAFRIFRLLVLLGLLIHVSSALRQLLSRHHLGITLLASFIIIVFAGVIIASLDPAIKTPWDGLWWAWVTITTVGYGDIVPVSNIGKVFASLLIAMGVGLFSMLTASFSAFFLAQEEENVAEKEQLSLEKLQRVEQKLDLLEEKIDRLIERQSDAERP